MSVKVRIMAMSSMISLDIADSRIFLSVEKAEKIRADLDYAIPQAREFRARIYPKHMVEKMMKEEDL